MSPKLGLHDCKPSRSITNHKSYGPLVSCVSLSNARTTTCTTPVSDNVASPRPTIRPSRFNPAKSLRPALPGGGVTSSVAISIPVASGGGRNCGEGGAFPHDASDKASAATKRGSRLGHARIHHQKHQRKPGHQHRHIQLHAQSM